MQAIYRMRVLGYSQWWDPGMEKTSMGRGFDPKGRYPVHALGIAAGCKNSGGGGAENMLDEGVGVFAVVGPEDGKNERGEGVLTPWARYRRTRSLLPWAAKFRRWGCRAYVESG